MISQTESWEQMADRNKAERERAAALNLPKSRDYQFVAECEDRLSELHAKIATLKAEERTARERGTFDYYAEQVRRVASGQAIEHPTPQHRQPDVVARELAITAAAIEPVQQRLREARRDASAEVLKTARPLFDKAAKRLKKALESAIQANQDMEDIRRHFADEQLVLIEVPTFAYVADLPPYWVKDMEKEGY